MDDLDREQVVRALKHVNDSNEQAKEALQRLYMVIRRITRDGPRGTQAELAEITGYSRERLRQITHPDAQAAAPAPKRAPRAKSASTQKAPEKKATAAKKTASTKPTSRTTARKSAPAKKAASPTKAAAPKKAAAKRARKAAPASDT